MNNDNEMNSDQAAVLSRPSAEAYKNWRWVRDDNGWIGGVCAGLARQFDVPVAVIRLAWFLSIWCLGFGLLLYVMCWISFPKFSRLEKAHQKVILGVCARIARRGDLDVGIARLIALGLLLSTFGAALVGYILLHFFLTESNGGQKYSY